MLLRLNGTQNCRTFHKSLKQWRSPTSSPPTSLRCFAATGWRALYISCEAAKADVAAQGRYAKPILGEGKRKTDDGGRTMCPSNLIDIACISYHLTDQPLLIPIEKGAGAF